MPREVYRYALANNFLPRARPKPIGCAMQLTIRLFGVEMLHVELCDPEPDEDTSRDLSGGTTGATLVGFTVSPGDQRWQPGPELE